MVELVLLPRLVDEAQVKPTVWVSPWSRLSLGLMDGQQPVHECN